MYELAERLLEFWMFILNACFLSLWTKNAHTFSLCCGEDVNESEYLTKILQNSLTMSFITHWEHSCPWCFNIWLSTLSILMRLPLLFTVSCCILWFPIHSSSLILSFPSCLVLFAPTSEIGSQDSCLSPFMTILVSVTGLKRPVPLKIKKYEMWAMLWCSDLMERRSGKGLGEKKGWRGWVVLKDNDVEPEMQRDCTV